MEHVGLAPRFEIGPRFDVRRRLGAGGMGVVFEAYDYERQELVALKTLRRHDAHWLARFKREFRSVHELAHPNLVAVHELFDTAAEPFFTMELVRGVDFLAWVRDRGRRNPRPSVNPLNDTVANAVCSIELLCWRRSSRLATARSRLRAVSMRSRTTSAAYGQRSTSSRTQSRCTRQADPPRHQAVQRHGDCRRASGAARLRPTV